MSLAFITFGCESVVDDLDTTPNAFTEVPSSLTFNHAVLNMASLAEAEPARIAGMWSDQFAGTDRQYISQDRYAVDAATFDEVWSDIYIQGITQAQLAQESATAEGNPFIANLSQGLQGYYGAEAALMFGDVPFSQVNDPAITDPAFESQEEVVDMAIAMLDAAANGSGADANASSANPSRSFNEVLATSSSWAQFFDALRARYLLAKADYAGALAAAREANFENASNSVDIIHTTSNFNENLFYQFEAEQRGAYLSFGTDGTEQSTIVAILGDTTSMARRDTNTNDAARLRLFTAAVVRGRNQINVNPGGFFAADANFPVIGFPEVQLILAESAARTGDAEAAIEALNKARNYWDDLTGTDSYQDYDTDDFGDGEDDRNLIQTILVEKYVSVFGLPTYYDVLRTNNAIGADMDLRDTPAQRFLYPSTESSSNANYPGDVTLDDPTALFD